MSISPSYNCNAATAPIARRLEENDIVTSWFRDQHAETTDLVRLVMRKSPNGNYTIGMQHMDMNGDISLIPRKEVGGTYNIPFDQALSILATFESEHLPERSIDIKPIHDRDHAVYHIITDDMWHNPNHLYHFLSEGSEQTNNCTLFLRLVVQKIQGIIIQASKGNPEAVGLMEQLNESSDFPVVGKTSSTAVSHSL